MEIIEADAITIQTKPPSCLLGLLLVWVIYEVNINIQYLEAQIQKTSIAEMREVFYTIIEEQIKIKMLAEASPEYAFVTVSPAMVPEEKSQPKRALICILGTLLGGMLAVLLVLVRHYAFNGNDKK